MAISRAHQPASSHSHGRLHKRGSSASSITSPTALSPLSDSHAFTFNRSETPKVTYEEPWNESNNRFVPMSAASSSHAHHQLKIKPYLRKLSSKDNNSLDLSRPAAENEGLAGLGISDYSNNNTSDGYSRSVSDVNFTSVNPRGRHTRTTSNTSQFSTTSSLRPTPSYMPPIRQTSPYSPPVSRSTPPSILDNDNEANDIMSDDELRLRQNMFDPARRSGSLSSTPGITPVLRIHTTGSTTRLGGSYSPSSVSLTSPIAQSRSRGDTLNSLEKTTSPSSRTSFDKAFGFMRGGRDSPVDPASRAASIQAARQAFNEKEQAKELKYSREAIKQAERDSKKQVKKDERQRRKSDARESRDYQRSRSLSDHNEKASRPSIGGRQYSDHRQAHSRALPSYVQSVDEEKFSGQPASAPVTKSRVAKGRWQQFIAWFRTRILRMGLHSTAPNHR